MPIELTHGKCDTCANENVNLLKAHSEEGHTLFICQECINKAFSEKAVEEREVVTMRRILACTCGYNNIDHPEDVEILEDGTFVCHQCDKTFTMEEAGRNAVNNRSGSERAHFLTEV